MIYSKDQSTFTQYFVIYSFLLPLNLNHVSKTAYSVQELTVKGELNINTKDRTINGKLEADVFAKKNQKIVVDYKASAKKDKDSYTAHDTLHIHSKVGILNFFVFWVY
jgi:hypothetical protein